MVIKVKVFLQRDISDIASRFETLDEKGHVKYVIKGKLTASGESMCIYDTQDTAVCRIRRLGFSAFAAYRLTVGDETARLNIAVTGGRATVRFRGISFCVRGDAVVGSYEILDADGTLVCAVFRDYAKGYTQLTIADSKRELFCIGAAVCIDSLKPYATPALQMT